MTFLMRIERWDPRQEGPLTEAALEEKLETEGLVVTRRTLAPGTVITRSCEGEEVSAVLSGLVRVTLETESAILGAGDSVRLLPGTTHQAEVLGSSAVVILQGTRKPL